MSSFGGVTIDSNFSLSLSVIQCLMETIIGQEISSSSHWHAHRTFSVVFSLIATNYIFSDICS